MTFPVLFLGTSDISNFRYISLTRTRDVSCTFPVVSEIWGVLHNYKIKDTWHLLYLSCTCLVALESSNFMYTSITRTRDISCTFPMLSEILCVLHISKIKDTWHLLYIYCGTRNFIFYYISNSRTHEWHFPWYYKIIISYFIFS